MTQTVYHPLPGVLLQLLEDGINQARREGVEILDLALLAAMVPYRSDDAVRLLVCRAEAYGLITRLARGVYVDPQSFSGDPVVWLTRIAAHLRPRVFSYVSLESCARGYGATSQAKPALTVVTQGRSARVATVFGILEFVHTKRPRDQLESRVRRWGNLALPVASRELLDEDLAVTRRKVEWPRGTECPTK